MTAAKMTAHDLDALEALHGKATAAPVQAVNLVHADHGGRMTPHEIGEYVANSVRVATGEAPSDFLALLCQKHDGPADVCHFGNGPTSAANAAYAEALWNAAPSLISQAREAIAMRAKQGRMFPLQTSHLAKPGPREIPWSIGEKAWQAYAAKHGYSQSCERIAARGGFGWCEMDTFYPQWREEIDELAALHAENERLRTQIDPESVRHWDTMRKQRDDAKKELRDLQHAVWHALDDSEDRGESDWVCVGRKDIDALSKLVPEDHPAALEPQ